MTINDASGDVVTESGTTAILDAPLSATGTTAYAGVSTASGLSVATFTDADPNAGASSYTAAINWGDGTSGAGVVAESSGMFTVSGTHAYATTGTFGHGDDRRREQLGHGDGKRGRLDRDRDGAARHGIQRDFRRPDTGDVHRRRVGVGHGHD